jgi:hypothetical protein
MYENITYEELKSLPEEKKMEVWKELHTLYVDNKALAKRLGIATIAVVNGVKKYVLGEPVGRASKSNKDSSQQKKNSLRGEKPKRKYTKRVNSVLDTDQSFADFRPVKINDIKFDSSSANSFSISVNKILAGDNAHFLLTGISNTLIKDQQYFVEIKIIEK